MTLCLKFEQLYKTKQASSCRQMSLHREACCRTHAHLPFPLTLREDLLPVLHTSHRCTFLRFHLLYVRQFVPFTSIIVWLPQCFEQRASRHQAVLLSYVFYIHLGSLGCFFATQTFCHQPRIFTHPGEAGHKNKGRVIC